VRNVSPRVKASLERMDVLAPWLQEAKSSEVDPSLAPVQARRVASLKEANAIANTLARAIASFVPEEDLVKARLSVSSFTADRSRPIPWGRSSDVISRMRICRFASFRVYSRRPGAGMGQ
jgi:hypothetical protein